MAKRIPLSFKENDRDLKLYDYVNRQDDKSCFIKKAIEFYIENSKSKQFIQDEAVVNNSAEFEAEDDEGIGEIMGC
ncbi:hypothetical protein [Clostridium sp. HMP27]|uniref:hypothetical protein n=1 Tax=Clostridium sp. HMP27 TaxID=1487921 RepID=UPI00052B83A8|nr:hypothetical protein [Clostridium sp. HMP27]KGK88059.1 hypothetical protein DP68_09040 [Clostridium sp. HMP27]